MDRSALKLWGTRMTFAHPLVFLVTILAPALIVGVGVALSDPREANTDRGRAACDRAIDTLLKSRDPVELQRVDILIRHLRCDVAKRLPSQASAEETDRR